MENKTGSAKGYTWTYVAQYRKNKDNYEAIHSSEEVRLYCGVGCTLELAREFATDFGLNSDDILQKTLNVSIRACTPGETNVFNFPIVETWEKRRKALVKIFA